MSTETYETRAHTTRDGVLNLSVNVGMADAEVDVIVQVKSLTHPDDVDANGWPKGFFERVSGSMPELQRAARPVRGKIVARMTYLPDTNVCVSLLRQVNPKLIAHWQATKAREVALCSIVVYELRHGAQRSSDPAREHTKLDAFLAPFSSLPFDDSCAQKCAEIRHELERSGMIIGPHDLQIAAIALSHGLTLVTHNTQEFSRIPGLMLEDWET